MDIITQNDNTVQLNPCPSVSSTFGFNDDSNIMVVNPERQFPLIEPIYFSEISSSVVSFPSNNIVSSSILGDALTASTFEQTQQNNSNDQYNQA